MQIRINNFEMSYAESGSGTPLLFIHGFPLSKAIWTPQLETLSSDFRIITPDLRGHGASQAVPGAYSMEQLSDDLNALLDGLQVNQPVVVCGHSMGGYIAFEFFRRYASRTAGLILTATRAAADSPEGKAGRDQAVEKVQHDGVNPIVEGMLPKIVSQDTFETQPELVEKIKQIMMGTSTEGVTGALLAMKERPDSVPTLPEINVPALVIHGAGDQIIPQADAEQMAADISDCQLLILDGAGHMPSLEDDRKFNHAVMDFMQGFG